MVHPDSAGRTHFYRFALLLQRIFLQFHQAFGCCEHADKGRNKSGQAARRALYLSDQLQESGHSAERQRVMIKASGTPEEGNKVAECEAKVQNEVAED